MDTRVLFGGLLLPALFLGMCCAQDFAREPERPPCNAANRGRLWPDRERHRAGDAVQICTASVWRYRWAQVTVSLSELKKSDAADRPKPDRERTRKVEEPPAGGR